MIDSFSISHYAGPCDVRFNAKFYSWTVSGTRRIVIASRERIKVTLYGHGADFALDAIGSNIHEWISKRGTTTDYADQQISMGGIVPKGYVTINIWANASQGLGNRTVTVKWLTGTEKIRLKIVGSCDEVKGSSFRTLSVGSGGGTGPFRRRNVRVPNILPSLSAPPALARPIGPVIATPRGEMVQVHDLFGAGLLDNVVTAVPVPKLTWGVEGVNEELANTQFEARLIDVSDPNNPRVLDTLTLPQGFPPNTPRVTKDNYPGRLTSIRVVKNPRFQFGTQPVLDEEVPVTQTYMGTFTEPGSRQSLDPTRLLIVADSRNQIDEDSRENDNELPF